MPRPLKLPHVAADTPSIDDLKAALELLTPETRPSWGTQGAAGMLRHCSRFMELYLGTMKAENARALDRHHTAHHFHQFGLT